jgi:mannose/fructose/N-acetylgalactosamine-specific phosphotransferase system component IID
MILDLPAIPTFAAVTLLCWLGRKHDTASLLIAGAMLIGIAGFWIWGSLR